MMRVRRNYIIDFFGLLIVLGFINPWFSVTPHYLIIGLICVWILLVLANESDAFGFFVSNKGIYFAIFSLWVRIFNYILGRAFVNAHDILLIFIIAFSSYYMEHNISRIRRILKTTIVYVCSISVFTLFRLRNDPLLCRLLARGDDAIHLQNGSIFTATAATIYAFTILCICYLGLLIYYKQLRYLPISILLLYVIFKSQFTIALLIVLVFMIIEFLAMEKRRQLAVIASMTFIVLIIVFFANLNFFSQFAISLVEGTDWSVRRISEVFQILSSGELGHGDLAKRVSLSFSSVRSFLVNPILGHGMLLDDFMNTIGGHSTFIDMLGSFGLLGGGSYILGFICSYIYYRNQFEGFKKRLYVITMNSYFVFSVINTTQNVVIYFVILFIVPSLIRLEFQNNKESLHTNYLCFIGRKI